MLALCHHLSMPSRSIFLWFTIIAVSLLCCTAWRAPESLVSLPLSAHTARETPGQCTQMWRCDLSMRYFSTVLTPIALLLHWRSHFDIFQTSGTVYKPDSQSVIRVLTVCLDLQVPPGSRWAGPKPPHPPLSVGRPGNIWVCHRPPAQQSSQQGIISHFMSVSGVRAGVWSKPSSLDSGGFPPIGFSSHHITRTGRSLETVRTRVRVIKSSKANMPLLPGEERKKQQNERHRPDVRL